MRLTALLLLGLLTLSGCYGATDTPLAHALLAVKAGDRAAFLRAKDEAHAALKTVWKSGGDTCKITPEDFQKQGEAALIDKLDHADLFRLDEAQRFVYASHIAGRIDAAMADPANADMVQQWMHPDFKHVREIFGGANGFKGCADGGGFDPLKLAIGGIPGEDARIAVFRAWQQELRDRAGDEDTFQHNMRRAAAELDANGFVAEWPAKLQLDGDDTDSTSTQTFSDLRKKLGD